MSVRANQFDVAFDSPLPIDNVLDTLKTALAATPAAVLVAPPGAGKTTRVPLALLGEAWLGANKILILEPRRLAARGAAERMAKTLGERVGDTVGLRARLVSKTGPKTRIEVITEGVLTRMVLDDPSLEGIGAVLFDEYHERSLDADFGLALALDAQASLRGDLRILVMSATLDGARVAALLGDAPVIESEGCAFDVTTHYLGRDAHGRVDDQMTDAIMKALRAETGSILAFLPGQGEIRRVEERLRERISDASVIVAPLYGAMDMAAQDRAVQPAKPGERKIVLATSIAETSLTIEGVRVVVDCGLARVPRYEPDAGITRLETVRVSRAAADQRRGRAGRTEPGVCYRLWDEPQTKSLMAYAEPEIRSAGLAGLLLDCAEWGVTEPATLRWLDAPPAAALDAARGELLVLGALDEDGHITAEGRAIRALPLPPRLARMVIAAGRLGHARDAADIAAVLVERGLGGNDTDLAHRIDTFRRDRSRRAEDMRQLAAGWAKAAGPQRAADSGNAAVASLLALAFPDRIAKARGAPGQFLLANGRGAKLDTTDALAKAPYLVVAELQGAAAATRILLAAQADEDEILAIAGDRISQTDEVTFDRSAAALRGRRLRRLDAIQLASEPMRISPDEASARLLAEGLAGLGIGKLPWSKGQLQLRDRVGFLRATQPDAWPDLSDAALAETAGEWLAPFLSAKTRLADLGADDLGQVLDTLLPWDLKRRLEAEAPTHFTAPTGNSHAIDYEGAGAPALHIRVQELFGLKQHPAIAGGKLPLTLNLLSPAHRPIQITKDLPGFWTGSWSAVKAEMKGRYPRHPWPDDPANAVPTARAKPRS
ncbi:MAG: ATP-dependent helicase HrpB [Hyphomicrobiaceae bacterium]|nr:ATP-dependent helicase HrpB [Hyphomicrobiaceae bacterium]